MDEIEVVIRIPKVIYDNLSHKKMLDEFVKSEVHFYDFEIGKSIQNGTVLPKGHGRKFEEIVVEYPPADLCAYPEYKGKPYFSIKYEENGEHIIGFGTYNPEVFSRYLREYFITPTIIEAEEVENE